MTTGYCILFCTDLLWKTTFITMVVDGDVQAIDRLGLRLLLHPFLIEEPFLIVVDEVFRTFF